VAAQIWVEFEDVAPQAAVKPQRFRESTLGGSPLDSVTGPHSEGGLGGGPRLAFQEGVVFLLDNLVCVKFPQCVWSPPSASVHPSCRAPCRHSHPRAPGTSCVSTNAAGCIVTRDSPRALCWELWCRRRPPARLFERHTRVRTGARSPAAIACRRWRTVPPRGYLSSVGASCRGSPPACCACGRASPALEVFVLLAADPLVSPATQNESCRLGHCRPLCPCD